VIRIVHLSDLHLMKPGAMVSPNEDRETWDKIKGHVLQEFKVDINVNSHDEFRLEALDAILYQLKPSIIVVTGDVTTYGERESFEFALEKLLEWRQEYKQVYCVPGNHDALQERFNDLRAKGGGAKMKVEAVAGLIKSFENVFRGVATPGQGSIAPMPFLDSYETTIVQGLGCPADPGSPKWVEASWGWLCFFLFNSVNDPGWMANEGRVGPSQYGRLNRAIASNEWKSREPNTLRVALLHHHPLPIPYEPNPATERAYDDMRDGSTLCYYLNKHRFHFLLHGHKHSPYMCRVQYDGDASLHVIAAGSATQAWEPQNKASFNVLDLLSPSECTVRRYEYRQPTGFEENEGCRRKIEPSMAALSFRYKLEEEADVDLRNIAKVNLDGYEDNHALELIEWNITITGTWDYIAICRLKGVSKGNDVAGIRQVLTGSPGHTWKELRVRAWQSSNKEDGIQIERISDEQPRQKCFRLAHPTRLAEGEEWDYSYEFHWQNEPPDKTFFDAINLYYYAHEVKELRYSITLPYAAVSPGVEARGAGIDKDSVRLTRKTDGPNVTYSFQVAKPPRLVYVIRLPREASQDA